MATPRYQPTVRRLMVAVAIVALSLWSFGILLRLALRWFGVDYSWGYFH